MLGFGHGRGGRRAYRGIIDSPRGESIFVTGVPKSIIRCAVARLIELDNGETGILDMKPFLEAGVFKKLKEPNAFKRVHVSFDTVEWDSGADLDSEFVYSKCHCIIKSIIYSFSV